MMRLPKFEYVTPQTIAEAVKIMAQAGPAGQFVAGGTDLYPNMKRRQQLPKTVISVMRLQELNQISGDGRGGLKIGASVILTDICEHPIINRDYPVVAQAAGMISTPLLRNMGTIGGNLLLDIIGATVIGGTSLFVESRYTNAYTDGDNVKWVPIVIGFKWR